MPMDEASPGCDLGRMGDPRPTLPDEVHGARAVGSLVVGYFEAAEAELVLTGARYLAGFLRWLMAPSVEARRRARIRGRSLDLGPLFDEFADQHLAWRSRAVANL